jgi:hypothetical protein
MDEDLKKARRNLLVISVLLIIFDVASVSVGKVSVVGTELVVGRPEVLRVLLWVFWAYLLLRYCQLLGAQADLGIRTAFIDRLNKYIRSRLGELGKKAFPSWNQNLAYIGAINLRRVGFRWEQPLRQYDPKKGGEVEIGAFFAPRWLLALSVLRAAFFVIFATPKFTEFVLPLLLAAAAPVVTLMRWV